MTARRVTEVGLQLAGYSFAGVADADLFEHVAAVAQTAEDAGFDSLWTMDHVHQIPSVGSADEPILEAYTTLAALAARTRRARLGVLVTATGFRAPSLVAKMITTIDVISAGRAVLGLGAGWYEDELRAYGIPFPPIRERLERLEDTVHICRAMFTEPAAVHAGRHLGVDGALNVPPPADPAGPPILIGGGGERVLIPLAARLADACNFFGGPATVRHKVGVLRRACEAAGRDPAEISVTWLGTALVTDSEAELSAGLERLGRLLGVPTAGAAAFALAGSPAQIAEQVAALKAAGVDGFIINMDDAHDLARVQRAGQVLAAAVRG